MCETDRLVREADIAAEVIRYLDVMLNMFPLSAFPLTRPSRSRSVSVDCPPLARRRLMVHDSDTGERKEELCRVKLY